MPLIVLHCVFFRYLLRGNDDLQEELSKNVDYINNELGKLAKTRGILNKRIGNLEKGIKSLSQGS